MSFDPTALLDIERRTGVKDGDIDDFLRKANEVEAAIKGMIAGTVDPTTIRIEGLESEEEKAKLEAERQKRLEESRRKAEELRQQRKQEERERWWVGAELLISDRRERGQSGGSFEDDDDVEENSFSGEATTPASDKRAVVLQRYTADYSRWNEWVPSDPASVQEEAETKAEEERKKNEEFEKNNKEFCDQFQGDMMERSKSIQKKKDEAEALRNKGNRNFKKKEFPAALDAYVESLKLQPYETKTLTNMAQVYIKLNQHDDALDFLGRALALEPGHVKALSRQAFVLGERKQFDAALKSIAKALKRDLTNHDLVAQQRELEIMAKEFDDEAILRNIMAPIPFTGVGVGVDDSLESPQPPSPPASSSSDGDTLKSFRSGAQSEMKSDFESADLLRMALEGALSVVDQRNVTEIFAQLKLRLPHLTPKDSSKKTGGASPANSNAFDELVQRTGANAMIKVYARTSSLLRTTIDFCEAVAACLQEVAESTAEGCHCNSSRFSPNLGVEEDLLTSCLHFVTIAVDGERASKLLLLEQATTLPALRSLLTTCNSQPEVVLAVTNLLYACCADDLCKKLQQAVFTDRKLLLILATTLGELVSRYRPMRLSDLVNAATADAAGVAAESSAVDSEARTLSVCKACIAISLLIKEISFSEAGKTALAFAELGCAVCAVGTMLFTYSREMLWDAHTAIESALDALLGLSQVEVLRGFFAVPVPMGHQDSTVDKNVMSVVEVILLHVLGKKNGANAQYASNCLAVLMNACLDTDGAVRAAVFKHGGMDEALKGLRRCGLDGGGGKSVPGLSGKREEKEEAIPDHNHGKHLLICRQAGLMSRLATVEGVQAVLYEPENYRLICRGIAAAAKPGSSSGFGSGSGAGKDESTAKLEAEGRGHLIRMLAALNQPPPLCRAVALQECLVHALIQLFPRPRDELGEITPQSVVLCPSTPESPILLGNAARCLMPYADDAAHAAVLFQKRDLVGVERLVNAMATCTDIRVRKNLAILLAKGCRLDGVRELLTHFRGMQMLTELQDSLVK